MEAENICIIPFYLSLSLCLFVSFVLAHAQWVGIRFWGTACHGMARPALRPLQVPNWIMSLTSICVLLNPMLAFSIFDFRFFGFRFRNHDTVSLRRQNGTFEAKGEGEGGITEREILNGALRFIRMSHAKDRYYEMTARDNEWNRRNVVFVFACHVMSSQWMSSFLADWNTYLWVFD